MDQSRHWTTVAGVIGVLLLAAALPWGVVAFFSDDLPRQAAHSGLPAASGESPIEALPSLRRSGGLELSWDGLQGLTVEELETPSVVDGQRPLKLTLAPVPGVHRLGIGFAGLTPNSRYRVTAWLQAGSATRIAIDVRDGPDRNRGIVLFDLAAAVLLGNPASLAGAQIATNGQGWQKASLESRTEDGRVFVYVGQLGPGDATNFLGQSKSELVLGGVQVQAIR